MGRRVEEEEVRKYGGVTLDRDEEAVLSLPPKYAVEQKMTKMTMKIEARRCFTKLRWDEMSKEEGGDRERKVITVLFIRNEFECNHLLFL